jgi:hypothetical protein
MRLLNVCTCAFLIAGMTPLLAGQDDLWKKGPGEVNLGRIATMPVPDGYEYIEVPGTQTDTGESRPANKNAATVLGSVHDPNQGWTLSFYYVPAPAPILNALFNRFYAWAQWNTTADRRVKVLNGSPIGITAKVLENDSYDPRRAAITFVISSEQAGIVDLKPKTRMRVILFFGRHGMLAAVIEAPESQFASADPECGRILDRLVISPDVRFHGIFEFLGPTPPGGAGLRWYALVGFLIGAGIAVLGKTIGNTPPART